MMGMQARIRRMYFREKVPPREIARRTGLSRNTVRALPPRYPHSESNASFTRNHPDTA